ncbi:colicin immunity domain-containing protein [Escherichia coli]|nr:colicin immunity domain-containing protein [Escherichia coli]
MFIAAERFEPDSDRADYEFDDNGLRIEVQSILEKFKL